MLETLAFVLGGLALLVATRRLAGLSGLPVAILLVVAGGAYSLLPGPHAGLDPEIVLVLVIPPLLYAAGLKASLHAIRADRIAIASLSVGLVLATALTVGTGLWLVFPEVGFAAAVALGAAVAPPDPVAALAIGRRAGLPPRVLTLIEGEGLLNDAVALTLFGVAIAAATGAGFSAPEAVGRLALATAGGVAGGVAVAWLGMRLRDRLAGDALAENAVALGAPFAAYLLAELVHGSGVLAVVVTALVVGHRGARVGSGAGRLQTNAVWSLVELLLEGYVFFLIGQQLPDLLADARSFTAGEVLLAVTVTVGIVLVVRPLWLLLTRRLNEPGQAPLGGREITALSWAGTRGVITLATAFALPLAIEERELLLVCAYAVVLVTLLGQGLTFAPLLRRLGLPRGPDPEEADARVQARRAAIEAALSVLDDAVAEGRISAAAAEEERQPLELRLQGLARGVEPTAVEGAAETVLLRREMADASRAVLLAWRDQGLISDEDVRALQRQVDFEEALGVPAR